MFFLQLLITYFVSNVHELALAEINGGIFICHIFAYFGQNEYFYTFRLQKHQAVSSNKRFQVTQHLSTAKHLKSNKYLLKIRTQNFRSIYVVHF